MPDAGPRETARHGPPERLHILSRIDPDTIHPARLAGPHAWHPWGLTTTPPDDRRIRLALPSNPRAQDDPTEQIVASIADQLRRPTWPPQLPLSIAISGTTIAIECDGSHYAQLQVDAAPIVRSDAAMELADVVTRDGWPILNELEALHDRITAINATEPSLDDLNDLAHWTASRLTNEQRQPRLATPLRTLLQHPSLRDDGLHQRIGLDTSTISRARLNPETRQALTHLQAQLAGQSSQLDSAIRGSTSSRQRR